MKYKLAAFLVVAFLVYSFVVIRVAAQQSTPRPRFEKLLHEETDSTEVVAQFAVFHDRETGQEIVCARGYYGGGIQSNNSISCYLTGRSW